MAVNEIEKFQKYLTLKTRFTQPKSPKTVKTYLSIGKSFLVFLNDKKITVKDVKGKHFDSFMEWKQKKRGFAPNTINTYQACLATLFKSWNNQALAGAVYAKVKPTKTFCPTKAQMLKTVEASKHINKRNPLSNLRNELIVRGYFETAFRVDELGEAKVGELNWETRGLQAASKGGTQEAILTKEWMKDYKRYLDGRGNPEGQAPLFANEAGNKLSTVSIYNIVTKSFRDAGVINPQTNKPYSVHDIRSANITWRAQRGENIYSIQRSVDHKDIRTTARYVRNVDNTRLNPLA